MATNILTTSSIDSLIYNYEVSQRNQLVSPLNNKKTKYEKLDSSYGSLSTKLNALKTVLRELQQIETDSIFNQKSAETSNSTFVSATATNSASQGSFEIRVNQLAKNDLAVSTDLESATLNAITGTHNFVIKTGDGENGEYISNIEVEFDADETNATAMEKIKNAINSDKAVVDSNTFTAANEYTGGASTFVIDINGTEEIITVAGGGTYEDLINEIVSQVNDNVDGVTAEKVLNSPSAGDVSFKLTVDDPDNYISISHETGFDLVADLNIGVTKEKGAAGTVTASTFSPSSGMTQLSITSQTTGLDNRIKELSDGASSSALNILGLNLGTARTGFDQSPDPDTAGFVYSDITSANNLLNSKFIFNGLSLQNSLNDISDVTNGVTFGLKSTMKDTDNNVNITVGVDVENIKSKIEDFVKKFNDVYTYIKNESNSTTDSRGIFVGDSNATSIMGNLRNSVFSQVAGITTGKISFLSQIGLSFNYTTGISIADSAQLESKISGSLDQVSDLFNSENGIANVLYDQINPYLGSDGYLAKSQRLFSGNITYIKDRITAVDKRIDKSSEALRKRYQQLQSQLANLQSLQNML